MATKKSSAAPKEAPPPKDKEAAPQDTPAPKKKPKRLIIGLLAGIALLAAGGAAAWYFTHPSAETAAETANAEQEPKAEKKPERKATPKKPPVFVALEPFTVNLQDEDGSRYLQVAVVLAATDTAVVDSIKLHMPMIRNGILLLLSNKHSEDLVSLDGKQQLAAEIAEEAAKPLAVAGLSDGVEGVYFSSFVIQ